MFDIPIKQITPPDSSYQYDKEELERLKKSIEENGLFHAIILQETSSEEIFLNDENLFKIVSGRARFIAMQSLNKETIPASILPSSCKNPHEIALHENLRRHNLAWYDQVELERELHELRVSQYGEKPKRRPAAGENFWSQNDTARELGLALGTFSQDMALATELKRNPNLRNIKDKTTALKVIKQIQKRQIAEIEQAMPSEEELDEILLGDSEVILKSFKNETFDCCITDPPWSEYKDESLRSEQKNFLPIFKEIFRVLKNESFLFLVTSFTDFPFYITELPKIGFKVQSYPLIWHKTKNLTYGRASWQTARDYEPIILAVKGNPSLVQGTEISSILKFDNVHHIKLIHPHEKPVELIEYLIRNSTHPGAKIVDPFSGSGVVLESCRKNDRRYLGIEKERKFYDLIVKRLEKK